MSRQFADNNPRPMDEFPSDDRKQDLLKEVLSATYDALRPKSDPVRRSYYQEVVDQWRGTPWSQSTIGESLVRVALRDWLAAVRLSQPAQTELVRDITQFLFEDPSSEAKLKDWWRELQEPKG